MPRAFDNKVSRFELCRLNYLASAVYTVSARFFAELPHGRINSKSSDPTPKQSTKSRLSPHSIEDHVGRSAESSYPLAAARTRKAYLISVLRLVTTVNTAYIVRRFWNSAVDKEAIKFVVLAHATANHLADDTPAASGASRPAILGKLVFPPGMAEVG